MSDEKPLYLRLRIDGRKTRFSYSAEGSNYREIGPEFDTSIFSDEYSCYGEFTGTFVGITCADRMRHCHTADFDFFDYEVFDDAKQCGEAVSRN